PAGRGGPVLARADRGQPPHRPAGAAGGGVPPERGPRRPRDGHGPRPALGAARPAVLPVPGVWGDALAAPVAAGVPREVPRALRRGLGCGARALVRAPARERHRAGGDDAGGAQPRRAVLEPALGERAALRGTAAGSVRGDARPHRRADRAPDRLLARAGAA